MMQARDVGRLDVPNEAVPRTDAGYRSIPASRSPTNLRSVPVAKTCLICEEKPDTSLLERLSIHCSGFSLLGLPKQSAANATRQCDTH